MNVFVLGSNGMLGKYCQKYLEKYYKVKTINRDVLDASEMTEETLKIRLNMLGVRNGDVLINCIGVIKPMVEQTGELKTLMVNSIFPRLLAEYGEKYGVKVIHPTTDCVFDGLEGNYSELKKCSANDFYGLSKSMGEPKNCTTIRTSIIGEEVGQTRSLIEWVKSSKNKKVKGFINHYWNGITCLEFAKICHHIIQNNLFWVGIKHIVSPHKVSKKELVEMISNEWDLGVTVEAHVADEKVDRTMCSIYVDTLGEYKISTLHHQLEELKKFSTNLYK